MKNQNIPISIHKAESGCLSPLITVYFHETFDETAFLL